MVQGLDIPGQWWGVFQSAPLNGLIERRCAPIPTSGRPLPALRVARENARAQRATLFPTLQAGLGASQNQVPSVLSRADRRPATPSTACSPRGLTHHLRARPVGRQPPRRSNRSRRWPRRSASSSRAPICRSPSNVVAAAIHEASLRAQIEATQRIIAAQRDTLDILRRQSGLGAITGADVAAQQAALAQAEATLPPLQKALAQQRNLLATLTGRLPNQSLAEQFKLADLKLPHELPLSLPSKTGRAAARRARRRGQSPFGRRPGRRRDRQPVPATSRSAPASTRRR